MRDVATSVYIIQEENDAALKIGIAAAPQKRLASIQTGNPRNLRLVFEREFHGKKYARMVEYMAHTLLANKRCEGEWFNAALNEAIKTVEDSVYYVDQFLRQLAETKIAEMIERNSVAANDP